MVPENERSSAQPRRRATVDTVESSCTLAMHQHNEINFTVLAAAPVTAEDENSTIGELQRLQRDSAGKAKLRMSSGEHTFLSDESLASVSDSASENTKLLKEQSNEDRRRRLSTDVEQSIKVPSGITITERMRQLSDLTVSRDMQSSFNSSANSSSMFNSFNSSMHGKFYTATNAMTRSLLNPETAIV